MLIKILFKVDLSGAEQIFPNTDRHGPRKEMRKAKNDQDRFADAWTADIHEEYGEKNRDRERKDDFYDIDDQGIFDGSPKESVRIYEQLRKRRHRPFSAQKRLHQRMGSQIIKFASERNERTRHRDISE